MSNPTTDAIPPDASPAFRAETTDAAEAAGGHESEAQFRELMAHLQQVFWMKNASDTAVLYVSPAYEPIWGRTRSSLYDNAHTFLDAVVPEDRERVAAAMTCKNATGGYEEEYRILRPDGTTRWIWARSYPVRDQQGEIQRYAGIAEDVSERKWAEKERARLAAIIELSEDVIISISLAGTVIAWNRGAERKYGYAAEEIIGRSILMLIPPEHCHEYLDVMQRLRRGESAVESYQAVRRRKDGTLMNFAVRISPIEARDGEVVGLSKIAQDISQVRKLENQLIEAQKMEVLGQLTGGIAHDFNNILSIILGYSELLMQDLGPGHLLGESVAAVRNAAERGARLTRQLLVFSRKETVQPAVVDLNELLEHIDGMLRQLIDANIKLTVTRGLQIGRIKADPGHLEQLLMNLVINARDAMPAGGILSIATTNVTSGQTSAADHPGIDGGDYVVLSVSDTGIGMSGETRARLFEPFFTTKPQGKGTGLGLTTCRTIVQQSGGHIVVVSELGRGTTFEIYFPRVAQPVAAPTQFSPPLLPRGTETLLVVEDDSEVRRLVCLLLRAQGYEVLTAANGEEALQTVIKHKGPAIRLVISDVVMPEMDGRALADRLGAGNPELKVLFTSGYTDDSIARHGVLGPDIAFLPKPYTISILARRVRELLDTPSRPEIHALLVDGGLTLAPGDNARTG